ncbi:MAG: UbiD family decarboxylase [Rhodospirillales bacterium]
MNETFRTLVDKLRDAGRLVDVRQSVDIRYLPALIAQTGKAVMFHDVAGYDMPVVAGISNSRENLAAGYGCAYADIERRVVHAIANPIEPVMVSNAPSREVVKVGGDVDLCRLPAPVCADHDGGPMITAGLTIVRDEEHGLNAGIYRYLVRQSNLTGIDVVTPNNLRRFAEKAFRAGKPLPISISLGTHLFENMMATFAAPIGTSELAIAGGLRGEGVRLAACETIDVPCLADAEIVLEAEILPIGWTKPEGRFGEFTRLMGGLHWNPEVRIKAISMRRNPIYYALHMPWEVIWLLPPIREAALRRALKEANIDVAAINVTPGASCFFHAVIAIRKQAGDGKNAIMAALSGAGGSLKHVVIVDDDIDVFDGNDVEWAIATRVQADRDVVIVSGARSKPLDPSIPPGLGIPTTAKMGIDATIPENVPGERYERITHPYAREVSLDRLVEGGTPGVPAAPGRPRDHRQLAAEIRDAIAAEPVYYAALSHRYREVDFQSFSRAVTELYAGGAISQDAVGRLCLADSPAVATPPRRG